MHSAPSNSAAWIRSSRARLTVSDAAYSSPGPEEVTIHVSACSMNPLDNNIQTYDPIPNFPIAYPTILGSDIAGTIVEIGSNVDKLHVGQRVMGHTTGFISGNPKSSGFQLYTVLHPIFVTPLPDNLSFSAGAVLPLNVHTAAAGLFQVDQLNLSIDLLFEPRNSTGAGVLLVWGGPSSVGCNVIQIACAIGLRVFATASESNFELCKALGAEAVFNYKDPAVVDTIVKTLDGQKCVGAFDCIGQSSTQEACAEIVGKVNEEIQGQKRVVSVLNPVQNLTVPADVIVVRCNMRPMFTTAIPTKLHQWLKEALTDGRMLAKPDATVFGHGLEAVQGALDKLKEGVSATKIVVTL